MCSGISSQDVASAAPLAPQRSDWQRLAMRQFQNLGTCISPFNGGP